MGSSTKLSVKENVSTTVHLDNVYTEQNYQRVPKDGLSRQFPKDVKNTQKTKIWEKLWDTAKRKEVKVSLQDCNNEKIYISSPEMPSTTVSIEPNPADSPEMDCDDSPEMDCDIVKESEEKSQILCNKIDDTKKSPDL